MFKISVEDCLEDLKEFGFEVRMEGDFVRLEAAPPGTLWYRMPWGVLDIRYEGYKKAYIPSKGYLKRYFGKDKLNLSAHLEVYDRVVGVLEKEGFNLLYCTDVGEL